MSEEEFVEDKTAVKSRLEETWKKKYSSHYRGVSSTRKQRNGVHNYFYRYVGAFDTQREPGVAYNRALARAVEKGQVSKEEATYKVQLRRRVDDDNVLR